MEDGLRDLALRLGRTLKDKGWMLAAAESCTGGLVSSLITDIPGASAWFAGAVVSYTNAAKRNILGVPQSVLEERGAVSRETVLAMARGARGIFQADVGLAVSGIAGPEGGTPQKPVGTVWMAWDGPFGQEAKRYRFSGDRLDIKGKTALTALEMLFTLIGQARPEQD